MQPVGASGCLLDYTFDAVRKREAAQWTVPEIVDRVHRLLQSGRTVAIEYRKFAGPPSVGPEGRRPVTPIPATVYLRRDGSNVSLEIERAGYESERHQFAWTELAPRLVAYLQLPYFERVEYVDSTDYKVVVARARQISGLHTFQLPGAVGARSGTTETHDGPSLSSLVGLALLGLLLLAAGWWLTHR